jgi:hypothetical protein
MQCNESTHPETVLRVIVDSVRFGLPQPSRETPLLVYPHFGRGHYDLEGYAGTGTWQDDRERQAFDHEEAVS